jgi:hypothetical protein
MNEINFLEELTNLVNKEDILAVNNDVNDLKSSFHDYILEEERKIQVEEMEEASEEELSVKKNELHQLKDSFFSLYNEYKEKKTALLSAQKLEQEANLRLKKNLIERLRKLIQEEENIGVAVASYKEIHETWKTIGDIPRDKRQDVQNEYSKLLESFFFNLKIYRELKEHDLKRNSQLKLELIEKIKKLLEIESIKEIESAIKIYQNEFDEIGPVVQTEWENIKEAYWLNVKAVYSRIQSFYENKRAELSNNIEKKKSLLEEVTGFVTNLSTENTIKYWEEKTQIILDFQNKWKEIGFGTKAENEELWVKFRAVCDEFFSLKKAYFDTLKEKNKEIELKKRKLIEKVQALKESTEWKTTTEQIIKLQNEWKLIGNAGQKTEQVLWREFRGACDSFFNNKQKHFEEADKQNEVNLRLKLDLIAQIEAYSIGENKQKAITDLREFSTTFNNIGKVPFKEKDEVFNAYKKAIDQQYQQLKLEGEEKEKAFFQAKIDSLKANPNADKLIDKEKRDLNQQIANLKQEINQFENNLGFFANSKGADALRKEVEQKIKTNKKRIEDIHKKIKQLVHE